MKPNILILTIFFFSVVRLWAQPSQTDAQISILSCTPGPELYTAFGHSALLVQSDQLNFNHVFNYGTFNFQEPNFYVKFMRGFMKYKLAVQNYENFFPVYKHYNQQVVKQTLGLNPQQTQTVLAYLQWNAQPENQAYMYDFFYDNCSSRLSDILLKQLKQEIRFDTTVNHNKYTFRQLVEQYTRKMPWAKFGINLLFGQSTDKPASWKDVLFLPDYQLEALRHAEVLNNGKWQKLVVNEEVVLANNPTEPNRWFTPALVFWWLFVFALAYSLWEFKQKKYLAAFDVVYFSIIGLAGLLLVIMWAFTEHYVTQHNWNLLWLFPTHLFMVYVQKQPLRQFYFLITAIAAITLFFFGIPGLLPQQFSTDFIPLLLIIVLRSFVIRFEKKLYQPQK